MSGRRRTRCVNDINSKALLLRRYLGTLRYLGRRGWCHPVAERRCGLDGNPLLPLQLHRVHLCSYSIPSSYLVNVSDSSGIVQDLVSSVTFLVHEQLLAYSFSKSRLSRIDMCGSADQHPLIALYTISQLTFQRSAAFSIALYPAPT